jgi:hypothetical protein
MSNEEILKKIWNSRNPVHEANADTGKDMFWETLLTVIDEFNKEVRWEGLHRKYYI